jgi:hypothetical protein
MMIKTWAYDIIIELSKGGITPIDGYNDSNFRALHKYHTPLESETIDHLEKLGFAVVSAPYHNTMSPDTQRILHNNFMVTGAYIRSRADRIAIHRDTGFMCQVEFKTSIKKTKKPVLKVEALPLALHIYLSRIGVKTIYVYHNANIDAKGAFWINENLLKNIDEIIIPPKPGLNRSYYEKTLREILATRMPRIRFTERLVPGFSNDPHAVLNLDAVMRENTQDLKQMLGDAIREYRNNQLIPTKGSCNSCGQVVDLSNVDYDPFGSEEIVFISCVCDSCHGYFCDEMCYSNHLSEDGKCE